MKIELENCQKSLTLKDFEEIESKLGYALPERLKEFYLQYNGGEPKQQTISINKYHEVEIIIFQPFKYNKSFKNALFHTVEGETLEHRSSNSISDNILLFASGHNNLRNIGVIAINIKNRAVYFYKIIGFVKNSDAFIFDEPQLIADSIDDFFNNLVAFPKIEEEQQTEIIEIEGVMPGRHEELLPQVQRWYAITILFSTAGRGFGSGGDKCVLSDKGTHQCF